MPPPFENMLLALSLWAAKSKPKRGGAGAAMEVLMVKSAAELVVVEAAD